MANNLGSTTLRTRRRATDPMSTYDRLPRPLRSWLADAALPWSPKSCKRIWDTAQNKGQSVDEIISTLSAAEQRALARDKVSVAA